MRKNGKGFERNKKKDIFEPKIQTDQLIKQLGPVT
jgi:hypothetical protein